jgi:hypothetical protein
MIKSKVSSYCLILSTLILGINVTSVSAQNTTNSQAIEAKTFINSINRAEQTHYFELQKFTDNLQDLQLTPPSKSYEYKLNIINNENLVQTVATPGKTGRLKTFTGALSFNNDSFNSILCRSEKYGQVSAGQIKLVEGRLQCPPGFKITVHQAQPEAISSIGATNRAQQAYFLETQNFAENHHELGYTPSNTYFNYKIDLLKNGELAQATATPRFDNLKSYLGGIFFAKNTNNFQSIVCASEQPTTNITQSIKVSSGKLYCPTGFKIFSPE